MLLPCYSNIYKNGTLDSEAAVLLAFFDCRRLAYCLNPVTFCENACVSLQSRCDNTGAMVDWPLLDRAGRCILIILISSILFFQMI